MPLPAPGLKKARVEAFAASAVIIVPSGLFTHSRRLCRRKGKAITECAYPHICLSLTMYARVCAFIQSNMAGLHASYLAC